MTTDPKDHSASAENQTDDAVLDLLAAIRRVAESQSAEVDRVVRSYFHARDSLEAVSREELMRRLRAGVVTVLDVRWRAGASDGVAILLSLSFFLLVTTFMIRRVQRLFHSS